MSINLGKLSWLARMAYVGNCAWTQRQRGQDSVASLAWSKSLLPFSIFPYSKNLTSQVDHHDSCPHVPALWMASLSFVFCFVNFIVISPTCFKYAQQPCCIVWCYRIASVLRDNSTFSSQISTTFNWLLHAHTSPFSRLWICPSTTISSAHLGAAERRLFILCIPLPVNCPTKGSCMPHQDDWA